MTSVPSPWMHDAPAAAPALRGDLDVDVAVVGAGYTGLSTALALREEGLSVAVLEREIAGFGASGRNAGHLTPTIGKDLSTLVRLYGAERAGELARLAEAAIDHVEALLARHEIDCAYDPSGNVVAAVHSRQHRRIERAADVAARLGLPISFLSPEDMRKRGLPAAFTCGYLERRGGTLHPGHYAQGLRRAALAAGALLFEKTPVIALEEGDPVVLVTPGGRVRARTAVLATNAYTGELGRLRSKLTRIYVSLFMTAPLSEAQRDRIDWRGREGIYTVHEILESYRLTPDARIVGGSKRLRYGFGGRPLPDEHRPTFAALEAVFRDRFPELSALPIERFWSGPIGLSLDFLPLLGRTGRRRNLVYAVGFAGHGLALASLAGQLVRDLVLEREGPGASLVERWVPPLPPEPLRWLLQRALTGAFTALDRRVDRAARRRARETG